MRRTGGWTTVALFFLGLTPVSPLAHERDDRMALGVPTLKSVEDLILAARKTARALPDEMHQSYPVPVPGKDQLDVIFLYGTSRVVPAQGVFLLAPSYAARLRADTGQSQVLKAVTPEEYGQTAERNKWIGKYALPPGMSADEFVAEQKRLYHLYDALLPPFAAGQKTVTPVLKKAAGDFLTLFPRITEEPLQPYYRAAGKDWFDWLAKVSK
jgi:hypothetical protein